MDWTQTGWMGHGGGWFWGMGLHGFFGIFLFLALVIAVIALIRYLWRGGVSSQNRSFAAAPGSGAALSVLESRYAKGEIERDEFMRRKQDLS